MRKKRKFKFHTGSGSEIALFTVHFQDKGKKKILQIFSLIGVRFDHAKIRLKSLNPLYKAEEEIFKACLLGTLNLCLKTPEQMQKNKNQSCISHSGGRVGGRELCVCS